MAAELDELKRSDRAWQQEHEKALHRLHEREAELSLLRAQNSALEAARARLQQQLDASLAAAAAAAASAATAADQLSQEQAEALAAERRTWERRLQEQKRELEELHDAAGKAAEARFQSLLRGERERLERAGAEERRALEQRLALEHAASEAMLLARRERELLQEKDAEDAVVANTSATAAAAHAAAASVAALEAARAREALEAERAAAQAAQAAAAAARAELEAAHGAALALLRTELQDAQRRAQEAQLEALEFEAKTRADVAAEWEGKLAEHQQGTWFLG